MACRLCTSSAVVLLLMASFSWAGGAAEATDTSTRGKYVAEQGRIIPADEIHIGPSIASIDYGYPDPENVFGVFLYTGHKQVSVHGQEEIIQIGIQGKRTAFEDLPILNLAFVFDKSGSMSEKDKIQYAKESFDLLIHRLRRQDIVSVVAFAGQAEVLLPATAVAEIEDVNRLNARMHAVMAEGPSSLAEGLAAGYEQVLGMFNPEYVNRVLLVSDGFGDSEKAAEVVQKYKDRGITLTTITVGLQCDLNMMSELAKKGAGSSRFLSDPEKMNEMFNTDLDRMVVPIAYNLSMQLELLRDTSLLDTWGYSHETAADRVRYFLPALHHRDYETILAQVRVPPHSRPGVVRIARFLVAYEDRKGVQHGAGPFFVPVQYADSSIASGGISDPRVLKAGTMLHIAQGLEDIGTLYYSCQKDNERLSRLNSFSWTNRDVDQEMYVHEVLALEQQEMAGSVRAKKQRCIDLAGKIKKEIENTRLRLDEACFERELAITRKYIEVIGRELGLGDAVVSRLLQDSEIEAAGISAGSGEQLQDLAEELSIALAGKKAGKIAFFGFIAGQGEARSLKSTADRLTLSELRSLGGFHLVGDEMVNLTLGGLGATKDDLLDTDLALRVGAEVRADFVVVGSILEMPTSIIVFGKVLNVGSAAVESVAQVILSKDQAGEFEGENP